MIVSISKSMNRAKDHTQSCAPHSGCKSEDKVLRRRQQYRIHQQRHRERLKNRMGSLESDVGALSKQITMLELKRKQMKKCVSIPRLSALDVKLPFRFVNEFLRLFKFGYDSRNPYEQEAFLRTRACHNLELSDITGIESHIEQWKLYSQFFKNYCMAANDIHLQVFDSETIVTVRTVIAVSPRREGVLALHPNLSGCEWGIQKLVQSKLDVPTDIEFHFNTNGILSKMFISGAYPRILRELGLDPDVVDLLFTDMRISPVSGVIHASPIDLREVETIPDPKLNIRYLLSDVDSDNTVMSDCL
uniref:Uncharacterized protein AlNc14C9G1129 n=1 Tax=Albugo laibachii Nc14 TaxID=890382 RepID=F0W254_9STRA|nr:conserved hypothetical protein [Albugo laibachii Nc14]|eukprot:CCA15136.1 conserved hypothetical protein [Albugo laibachii Nc14]